MANPRRMLALATVVLLLSTCYAIASDSTTNFSPLHPVNTYSIVCYDSATGELGAAVQSHWFKVADVIWVEPLVGAVATQSLAEFSYGPLGLHMMALGKAPDDALRGLLEADVHSDVRQVAFINADGQMAVHTGENCIAEAGHRTGPGYSVQANLMEKATVWDAMAEAFENTEGDLADRMMAALVAAQAEGGDIRGKQSAAMVVVTGDPTGQPWNDRLVDIRVDDSPEPLKELQRLLDITRAYDWMNYGDELLAEGDLDSAAIAYEQAALLAPGNMEIVFWHAVTLVEIGEVERALPLFKQVFDEDERWRVLIPRLVDSDLFPSDQEVIDKVMAQ